jgi:hypothetical protein
MSFSILPLELLASITHYLNVHDLAHVSQLCRQFHIMISDDDYFWKCHTSFLERDVCKKLEKWNVQGLSKKKRVKELWKRGKFCFNCYGAYNKGAITDRVYVAFNKRWCCKCSMYKLVAKTTALRILKSKGIKRKRRIEILDKATNIPILNGRFYIVSYLNMIE